MTAPTVLLSSRGADVRQEVNGSRWYGGNTYSPDLLASVTTVLGSTSSKPWLTAWAAKLAATFAVEQHALVSQTLTAAGTDAAIDLIKGAATRKRNEASERGTFVHDIVEAFALDRPLPDFTDQDDVAAFADAFVDWCIEWEPEFLAAEATVANPADGWAGTLDLILRFPRWPHLGVWEVDVKTGENLDASMPVQLATYKHATEVWLPLGRKAPMPPVDRCVVLHLRPEGAKIVDVTDRAGEDAYSEFLLALELLRRREASTGSVGQVLYPPLPDGSQPPPLLVDLEGVPACAALVRGGITRLDHLADCTADDLASLSGVGPKSILALRDFLQARGLDSDHLDSACDDIIAKAAKAAERKAAKQVAA